MKMPPINTRTITLLVILVPLLTAFGYVAVRSGPLAPVPVTVTEVSQQSISPALFGIGIVQARYSYRIGPTLTGHVLTLNSHVGDKVVAGQVLGDMDPVDMDNKIISMNAAIKRAKASLIAADAHVVDATARKDYAQSQSRRYQELLIEHTVSAETAEAKYQEYQVAKASLAAARANLNAAGEELEMLKADYNGLLQQRSNLRLVSPVDGLVVGRYIEPGSTVVAGQPVLEVIDPASIWINVRFDQLQSSGLSMNLPARILLRSQSEMLLSGHVSRVEPLADSVTEEILAKVVFDQIPNTLPPVGELAEVTVSLPQLASAPVVPNASIKQFNGKTGVWLLANDKPQFVSVETGASDLDGQVQILKGLESGARIIVYSKQELSSRSRISIVDHLVDAAP